MRIDGARRPPGIHVRAADREPASTPAAAASAVRAGARRGAALRGARAGAASRARLRRGRRSSWRCPELPRRSRAASRRCARLPAAGSRGAPPRARRRRSRIACGQRSTIFRLKAEARVERAADSLRTCRRCPLASLRRQGRRRQDDVRRGRGAASSPRRPARAAALDRSGALARRRVRRRARRRRRAPCPAGRANLHVREIDAAAEMDAVPPASTSPRWTRRSRESRGRPAAIRRRSAS